MNTEITLLKWPGEEDWMFAKSCALVTIGKHSGKAPDMEWKHKMLRAKHSPIRTLNFAFYLHNVPYYVSTHLARHVHSVPFIKSQRNDRQSDYDRNAARQDEPVDMIWYMNAEELLTVASKRLCRKADETTRGIVKLMCCLVADLCPEFRGLMAPAVCVYVRVPGNGAVQGGTGMTYMEAWKLMAPQLRPETDEQINAYIMLFGAVKIASKKEEQHGKAGKADQEQQPTVL